MTESTPSETPLPIEPTRPRKKRTTSLVSKKKKRRVPWYQSCEDRIVLAFFHPYILSILNQGVSSKTDLRSKLEALIDGVISAATFNRWLKALDLDSVFTEKKLFRVPLEEAVDSIPRRLQPSNQLGLNGRPISEDNDGFDDPELKTTPPPFLNQSSTSPPAGGGGEVSQHSNGNGWVPPPDPMAPVHVHDDRRTVLPG